MESLELDKKGPLVAVPVGNVVLTLSSSVLSLFGGFVIILTYIKMKEIRNYTRTLLVYLTIADLLTASGNLVASIRYVLVNDIDDDNGTLTHNCSTTNNVTSPVCVGQSFVTTVSNLSSFLWTAIIAIHICASVVWKSRKTEVRPCIHFMFHAIGWGVPVAIVTPLLVKGYLGEDSCYGTGVWCGIRSDLPRETIIHLMYLADVGWQASCYILAAVLYGTIKLHLWLKRKYAQQMEFQEIAENLRNGDRNFLYFCLVIYSLKLWGVIRFWITITAPEEMLENSVTQDALKWLLYMQSYGASGQAFWNFVLFCVCDKDVREHLKRYVTCKLDR